MSGKLGQNLRVDERIVINRTTDPELDGKRGTILGMFSQHAGCSFHIVMLDTQHSRGDRAICLIESCIDRLSNQ